MMTDNAPNTSVEQLVFTVLKDKLNIDENLLGEKYWNIPLTCEPFNCSSVNMVYLLLEIEKKFGVRIHEKYLQEYGFSTLGKIIHIVKECIVCR